MDIKIAFLGTPEFAVPILRSIIKGGYKVSCVFSQPPRKSHRGQKINKSPVHIFSEGFGIQIKTPNKIEDEMEFIKSLNLDIAIVVAYGQILPEEFVHMLQLLQYLN